MWHTLFFLLNHLTYTIIKTRLCTKLHDHATIDQIVVIASDFAMQYLTFAKNIFFTSTFAMQNSTFAKKQ
nr:hypothetical protein [Cnaphalocrocis medinalis granulovirus]